MRWPAILLVVLTTLTLTMATGRGCADASHRSLATAWADTAVEAGRL